MARWATLIEIAGVSFTGCRGELLDPEGFQSAFVGSSDNANDFVPHVQVVNRGVKGIKFGIRLASAEQTKLADMLEAIQEAQNDGETFVVEITEGLYTINVNAVPDYNSGSSYLKHGKHSEGWYEDVEIRFESVSQGT